MGSINVPITQYDEYLNKQGISSADATQMGLRALSPNECSMLLGYPIRNAGVLIPYPDSDYFRVRVLGKSDAKYLSRKASGTPPIYQPSGSLPWEDLKVSSSYPLAITEGEFKAYWGSKMGLPTLGIGGVEMQATLFNAGVQWEGRTVFIVFDHDGVERGAYKPGVANALGKLASQLQAEGALVKVVNIGRVERLAQAQKWGLDDALRSGVSWEELIATCTEAPEWCSKLAGLLTDCAYVTGTNHTHVYNLVDHSRKALSDFHDAHIEKFRRMETADGKFKVQQISKLWTLHPHRLTVSNYTLDPRHSFGVVEDKINLWKGYPIFEAGTPDKAAWVRQEWQKFMEGLFGEHWQWVGLWAGHLLNRPWERTNQAVMLVTMVQGIGKSLLGDVLRDLTGEHGLEGKASAMFSPFNSEMEAKTFVMINELDVKFGAKEGQLNDLLSEETVRLEQKGKDVINLPNLRRWYLTTNTSSPCRLSKGQRRVLVINPPRIMSDTRGEWGTWVREVVAEFRRDPEALAAVRSWFDNLWFDSGLGDGVWRGDVPVPETQAGLEAAEASMTVTQIVAGDMYEHICGSEGGWGAAHPDLRKRDVKAFGELTALVKAHGGFVGQKNIKEDGVVRTYTIYDSCGRLSRSSKPSSGNHSMAVESGDTKEKALGLAATYVKLQEILTGKG